MTPNFEVLAINENIIVVRIKTHKPLNYVCTSCARSLFSIWIKCSVNITRVRVVKVQIRVSKLSSYFPWVMVWKWHQWRLMGSADLSEDLKWSTNGSARQPSMQTHCFDKWTCAETITRSSQTNIAHARRESYAYGCATCGGGRTSRTCKCPRGRAKNHPVGKDQAFRRPGRQHRGGGACDKPWTHVRAHVTICDTTCSRRVLITRARAECRPSSGG